MLHSSISCLRLCGSSCITRSERRPFISYRSDKDVFEKDVERVSILTSEGIPSMGSTFMRPVNGSLTMANDNLLKDFFAEEPLDMDGDAFIQTMREYLDAYWVKYGYDFVFLASKQFLPGYCGEKSRRFEYAAPFHRYRRGHLRNYSQ